MDRLLEATRRAEQRHFWFRGFRAFVRPLIAEAVTGRPSPKILDCGCGTGANLVMLSEYGRPYGFDVSWQGLQFARGYGQTRIARASITRIPFPDAVFDVVTVFDVLYSLSEEQESAAVQEVFRVLRPDGSLIVNVAALRILRGSHSVFGAELRRSTRRRLRALLSRYGFDVVRLTYTNFVLFPLMLAVRTAQRAMGLATPEEAGVDIAVPPALFNDTLAGLLQLEAHALRRVDMPIGSSLLCVARRPSTFREPQGRPERGRGTTNSGRPEAVEGRPPSGQERHRQEVGRDAGQDRARRGSDEKAPEEGREEIQSL